MVKFIVFQVKEMLGFMTWETERLNGIFDQTFDLDGYNLILLRCAIYNSKSVV